MIFDINPNLVASKLLWRNWLARSAVNRKVGGSSPPRSEIHFGVNFVTPSYVWINEELSFAFVFCPPPQHDDKKQQVNTKILYGILMFKLEIVYVSFKSDNNYTNKKQLMYAIRILIKTLMQQVNVITRWNSLRTCLTGVVLKEKKSKISKINCVISFTCRAVDDCTLRNIVARTFI